MASSNTIIVTGSSGLIGSEVVRRLASGSQVVGFDRESEDAFIKPWMIDLADDHYALDVMRASSVLG